MKKTYFLVFAVLFGFSSFTASGSTLPDGPLLTFKSTSVDYGTIPFNANPVRKFTFTNKGNKALIITGAKGSCGCTVPSYPKEPVLPGASADIEVRYDTSRVGKFQKTVTVTANDGSTTLLTIMGEVSPEIK